MLSCGTSGTTGGKVYNTYCCFNLQQYLLFNNETNTVIDRHFMSNYCKNFYNFAVNSNIGVILLLLQQKCSITLEFVQIQSWYSFITLNQGL
jgi:hypothetical protein